MGTTDNFDSAASGALAAADTLPVIVAATTRAATATIAKVKTYVTTSSGAPSGFANWQPVAATSGTDTTPATGTQFVTSLFIPCAMTLTGVSYLIGSVGGTDKVYAVLYSSAGAVLANSSLTSNGATVGTAANIQALDFTATYAAAGPGLYYVGISMNGNTARLRTIPAFTQAGTWGNTVSQTHATVAAITPMVAFTADKAPIVFVY